MLQPLGRGMLLKDKLVLKGISFPFSLCFRLYGSYCGVLISMQLLSCRK